MITTLIIGGAWRNTDYEYMKEKIKVFIKNNLYNIVVILAILGAFLTIVYKNDWPILLFILMAPFFIAVIWFFYKDKQIKEFKDVFNKKFPFLGKTIAIIFRTFIFLTFLLGVLIIAVGVIDTFKHVKEEKIRMDAKQYILDERKKGTPDLQIYQNLKKMNVPEIDVLLGL